VWRVVTLQQERRTSYFEVYCDLVVIILANDSLATNDVYMLVYIYIYNTDHLHTQNKYIHRRDSLSLAALSAVDKEKLAKIGVVTEASHTFDRCATVVPTVE
jgi:hypothetical protein